MKKLFFVLAAMGLFAACTPDNGGNNGGNGGNTDNPGGGDTPTTSSAFTLEVEATACKANIVVTPSSEVVYHYNNVVSAAKYVEMGGSDAAFLAAYIAERTATFENNGYTWLDMVSEGVDEWTRTGLEPETDYYVIAFGVDANGKATTELAKQAFTTEAAKDYSSWFGYYQASTPKSYSFLYDSAMEDLVEAVEDLPKSQFIWIQDAVEATEDPSNAGLALVWNISAFFEDTEVTMDPKNMMYALGEFNADGELELANMVEMGDAGGGYVAMWLAYCSATGISQSTTFVNGEYAAHSFPLPTDGVSVSVPYKGGLSGGGAFEVAVFDIFATNGQYVNYFIQADVPVNCFYGPITLNWFDPYGAAPLAVKVNKNEVKAALKAAKTVKSGKNTSALQAKVRL